MLLRQYFEDSAQERTSLRCAHLVKCCKPGRADDSKLGLPLRIRLVIQTKLWHYVRPAWILLVLGRKMMKFHEELASFPRNGIGVLHVQAIPEEDGAQLGLENLHFDCHKLKGTPLAVEPEKRTHLCFEKRTR